MAHIKSAQKEMRASERRRIRNKSIRSRCKTSITKAEKFIFSGKLEQGQKAVIAAVSTLDKAAEKGVIHPNNAARHKARLMKRLNEAQTSTQSTQSATPVPQETEQAEETEE